MNFYKKFLSLILCSLGFVACSSTDALPPDRIDGTVTDETLCEYGCPYAVYKVLGSVVNEKNEPIKGIEVEAENIYEFKKIITDDKGNFVIEKSEIPNDEYKLSLKDIDGKDNGGEFEAVKETVSFKGVNFTGGDDKWNMGTAEKDVTVVMKEKTDK
ncbi:MAG: radical SAM-associated putative lipoprotein [Bacteroidetes bacterium]|nr:radical SAM-associated putative lipoprotein [Bacteroidota bacterium]